MELDLNNGEVCIIIALCDTCGQFTDKAECEKISQKLKKSLGID